LRDPDNVSSTAQLKNEIRGTAGRTLVQFYKSHRVVADPTLIFPYALGANQGLDLANLQSHKMFWIGDYNNSAGNTDEVMPALGGSGFYAFGNTSQPKLFTPLDTGSVEYPNNLYFDTSGKSTKFSRYQSGDVSTPGANDAVMEFGRTDVNGTVIRSGLGDPFFPNGETPTQRYFDGTFIINAQITSPVGGYANVQHGQSDFYIAEGANCRARVIASSSPTYAGDTDGYDIPPDYWSNANNLIAFSPAPWESALGYYHVVLGDGTVRENVTVVDA
jgi:hypothetical protein